mmetsp:Transcript_32269/g.126282  ORF Transcript_32269/g.126282 Transcript_32269/m.126282 type:complete len:242 (-) Transcript_32269:516-1241(-)
MPCQTEVKLIKNWVVTSDVRYLSLLKSRVKLMTSKFIELWRGFFKVSGINHIPTAASPKRPTLVHNAVCSLKLETINPPTIGPSAKLAPPTTPKTPKNTGSFPVPTTISATHALAVVGKAAPTLDMYLESTYIGRFLKVARRAISVANPATPTRSTGFRPTRSDSAPTYGSRTSSRGIVAKLIIPEAYAAFEVLPSMILKRREGRTGINMEIANVTRNRRPITTANFRPSSCFASTCVFSS